jgi:hypothetical protein
VLTGIHFLLSYRCLNQCDHCFLHCGPAAPGTFTLRQVRAVFDQIREIDSIQEVYFEGGEPFLVYPLLVEGLELAHQLDLRAGVVTNAYWATSVEDAKLWLAPLRRLGVSDLSISEDVFHQGTEVDPAPGFARRAAERLGIPCATICIEAPTVGTCEESGTGRGRPVVGGGVRFRGRAAERLTAGLPTRPCATFTSCPYEKLEQPERVHVDAFGHVHICQGLTMGNMWRTPLAALVRDYDVHRHPLCGPLAAGGPARLSTLGSASHAAGHVDACHCCYETRKSLLGQFPGCLGPRQVYGLADPSEGLA